MMRYLLFSSFFLLFCCSDKIQPSQEGLICLTTARPAFETALYRTSVDVYGVHISGLMFFKAMPDSSRTAVFTTETGFTFFNFSWDKNGKFEVKHIVRKLDRKIIVKLLRKDLELILVPATYSSKAVPAGNGWSVKLKKETTYFYTSPDCASLERAEVRHKKKFKTEVSFFPVKQNVPDSIYIEHLNFNMQLAFSRINRNDASE